MLDLAISRRAALMGAGAAAAWLASPARALLQAAGRVPVPAFVDQLIVRMTLEEKAGQLQLMASAWGGGAALSLNPPGNGSDFQISSSRQMKRGRACSPASSTATAPGWRASCRPRR
jgi:beta-glucosidase